MTMYVILAESQVAAFVSPTAAGLAFAQMQAEEPGTRLRLVAIDTATEDERMAVGA